MHIFVVFALALTIGIAVVVLRYLNQRPRRLPLSQFPRPDEYLEEEEPGVAWIVKPDWYERLAWARRSEASIRLAARQAAHEHYDRRGALPPVGMRELIDEVVTATMVKLAELAGERHDVEAQSEVSDGE